MRTELRAIVNENKQQKKPNSFLEYQFPKTVEVKRSIRTNSFQIDWENIIRGEYNRASCSSIIASYCWTQHGGNTKVFFIERGTLCLMIESPL